MVGGRLGSLKRPLRLAPRAQGKKVGDGKVEAGTLMTLVDPRQEWMQMFDESWQLERNFYYDPAMDGIARVAGGSAPARDAF